MNNNLMLIAAKKFIKIIDKKRKSIIFVHFWLNEGKSTY